LAESSLADILLDDPVSDCRLFSMTNIFILQNRTEQKFI